MKKYFLTIVFVTSVKLLTSQDNDNSYLTRPLDGLYFNLLGDASIISINFEKLFPINKNLFITSKLGLGYSAELLNFQPRPAKSFVTIPFHLTTIVGGHRSFAEIGFGATASFGDANSTLLYPILGYRLQPVRAQKLSFRIFIQWPTKYDDIPYFFPLGVSLGFSF